MATRRLSKLQRQILSSMWTQYERTQGGISTGHLEWVQTLGRDKSNVSHSLRTLEARGLITIGRTAGGQATPLDLTSEGRKLASELRKSCDEEIENTKTIGGQRLFSPLRSQKERFGVGCRRL